MQGYIIEVSRFLKPQVNSHSTPNWSSFILWGLVFLTNLTTGM